MKFKKYDVVIVVALHRSFAERDIAFNFRKPVIGDTATILEIHLTPPGYKLECNVNNGITQWPIGFAPDELELELVR
ncbi:MAG TPA: hypothetical protein VIE65_11935 [Methylobacter sp.]|jgi:hypothetical protein